MRNPIRATLILFLSIHIIIISSCKKGDAGPAGPEGKSGTANITANTYTITSWPFSSPYYYANIPTSVLTTSNTSSAAVMVYFSTGNGDWHALPYTQYDSPYDYFMGFNTSIGNVEVTWFYDSSLSSGSSPNAYYGTAIQIKVVVIPPALIKPSVNTRDYKEVKEAYQLSS